MKVKDLQLLERWADDLGGIYALSDLKVLFGAQTEAALYKKLQSFVAEGVLVKVKRGVYAKPDVSLPAVSARLYPNSYLSLGTVLADAAIVGAVPGRRVQAVKTGSPRRFICQLGTVEYLSIAPKLFFGFEEVNGIRRATPEKAFLDACYFTFKGKSLSFDIDTDVDRSRLDSGLLGEYLARYDQRFITFYRRVISDD